MSALLDLRASLATALSGVVGAYTLANGSVTPAMRCSDPSETRYPGTIVQGLEVVILKDPELVPVRQYQEERAQAEWTVFLVAWGEYSAAAAAQLVIDAFPGTDAQRVNVPEGIGPQDQYQLTIRGRAALPLDALVFPGLGGRTLITLGGLQIVTLDGRRLVTQSVADLSGRSLTTTSNLRITTLDGRQLVTS